MTGPPLNYRVAVEIRSDHNKFAPKGSLFYVRASFPRYASIDFVHETKGILLARQASFQLPGIARWPHHLDIKVDVLYDLGDRLIADAPAYRIVDVQPLNSLRGRVLVVCNRDARGIERKK